MGRISKSYSEVMVRTAPNWGGYQGIYRCTHLLLWYRYVASFRNKCEWSLNILICTWGYLMSHQSTILVLTEGYCNNSVAPRTHIVPECQISTQLGNMWLSYWRFVCSFCKVGQISKIYSWERDGPNCVSFAGNRGPSSLHPIRYFGADMFLCFEMRVVQRRLMSKIWAKFCTFWLPVSITAGMGRCLCTYGLWPNFWYTFDGRPLCHLQRSDKT